MLNYGYSYNFKIIIIWEKEIEKHVVVSFLKGHMEKQGPEKQLKILLQQNRKRKKPQKKQLSNQYCYTELI